MLMPCIMWASGCLFLFYQFIPRIWPGLILNEALINLNITETEYGMMASIYYWGYGIAQIPTAILINRFSARVVIPIFAVLCGLMMILSAYTNNFYLACLARLIIGITSTAGIIGTSDIITRYFHGGNYARMLSLAFSVGMAGAIYAGGPVSLLLQKFKSQDLATYIGYIGIGIGALLALILSWGHSQQIKHSNTNSAEIQTQDETWKMILKLVRSKEMIILGLINLLLVGVLEGFADVWGIQYMMNSYGITKQDAAMFTSLVFSGLMFGAPLMGWISKYCNSYFLIIFCGIFTSILMAIILGFTVSSNILLYIIFLTLGFLASYQLLVLNIGALSNGGANANLSVAFLNSMNMLGGSFFHAGIGSIMAVAKNTQSYQAYTYTAGLSLIPIASLIGSILAVYLYFNNKK